MKRTLFNRRALIRLSRYNDGKILHKYKNMELYARFGHLSLLQLFPSHKFEREAIHIATYRKSYTILLWFCKHLNKHLNKHSVLLTALIRCVYNNDIKSVKWLLNNFDFIDKKSIDINNIHDVMSKAVYVATFNKYFDIHHNTDAYFGPSCMYFALKNNDFKMITWLQFNTKTNDFTQCLHHAIQQGNLKNVKFLCKYNINKHGYYTNSLSKYIKFAFDYHQSHIASWLKTFEMRLPDNWHKLFG
jgi:hypothetical protein